MTILKKCKPKIFESHNSLKLSFTKILGLSSNFVACKSFHESNSPGILVLCETNLDDSIDSDNFSVMGYLLLIRKSCSYVKEGFLFAWDLPLKIFVKFYLCFQLALLHSVSFFFFCYWSPSWFLCMVFDCVLSNILDKYIDR